MSVRTLGVLAVASLAAAANANTITTLFATNNGGSPGGAVYFDIVVGPNPITITGFDVNTSTAAGTPFGFQAWTIPNSYVGNTGNQGLWTQVTTGSGVAAGTNLPSSVTLNNTFVLAANGHYGITLILADANGGSTAAHAYTNGTGANQAYSNADLSLSLGAASNTPFNAAPFTPRVWNGTIYYNVPSPAGFALLGMGGLLAARRRR
jgi:hypothetical protein